jgi:bifunctional DNA-binding transcriptional regulator/antitoxin component of YhaV-PrlF toxin-antitoxin module
MERFEMVARIDSKGNLLIPNKAEWREFLRANANKTLLGTFEATSTKSTEQVKKFYFGYVLPKLQQGFYKLGSRYSIENLNRLMKAEYYNQIDSIDDLDTGDWRKFIEWIRQYAATNLDTVIEDAK